MQTIEQNYHDYKVLMTHLPVPKLNGKQMWRATLTDYPSIVEEAFSRDQVINQIKARIVDMLSHSEIITLRIPTSSAEPNGIHDELLVNGWDDHGFFKDDPEALKLFDEIEEERSRHLVGGE